VCREAFVEDATARNIRETHFLSGTGQSADIVNFDEHKCHGVQRV
jgi:hypothetical protein